MPTSYVQYIHYDHIMYMLYTYMHMLQSHIYTHTYICIHVCIHIHMHIHIHIHIKTHIHMHIHIHIRLKHVCAHTNVCIYIYTYIHKYICIHTYQGSSEKKQPSCHSHCEETCMPYFPQFNVVTSLCLDRKIQPFPFGCRHALGNNIDQGGAGGSGVIWQQVGGWLCFFEEPGFFLLMDVQPQAWTDSLLHVPKP